MTRGAGLRQMATGAYPFLGTMKPQDFARLLGAGEVAVGSALLLPVVPSGVAGALLTGFSGGLLGLYIKIPGMRQEGSLPRPARASRWPRTAGCWASASACCSAT